MTNSSFQSTGEIVALWLIGQSDREMVDRALNQVSEVATNGQNSRFKAPGSDLNAKKAPNVSFEAKNQ